MKDDLIYRLRKRAEIRRNISTRKSVQEGKPDKIADLLEEAAQALYDQQSVIGQMDDIIDRLEQMLEQMLEANDN